MGKCVLFCGSSLVKGTEVRGCLAVLAEFGSLGGWCGKVVWDFMEKSFKSVLLSSWWGAVLTFFKWVREVTYLCFNLAVEKGRLKGTLQELTR